MNSKITTLTHLRWFALAGTFTVLALAAFTGAFPQALEGWWLAALFAASNLASRIWGEKIPAPAVDLFILGLILFDLIYLTLLLMWNGGAHNPFAVLFVAISGAAALTLPRPHLLAVIFVSLVYLWQIYGGSIPAKHMNHDNPYAFHLQGMWLANSLSVIAISLWIHHLRIQGEHMAAQHQEAQRILAHVERVESMGRMLATTAHKLNTPLGTLQLGVSELANTGSPLEENEKKQWLEDMQKALDQIDSLFLAMKETDDLDGTDSPLLNLADYLKILTERWSSTRKIKISYQSQSPVLASKKIRHEIGNALEALLENAADAQKSGEPLMLDVHLETNESHVLLLVKDNGVGMSEKIKAKAGEPLFTTKKTGTGLGLYICHQLALKLGGTLHIESTSAAGTKILLSFLREQLA